MIQIGGGVEGVRSPPPPAPGNHKAIGFRSNAGSTKPAFIVEPLTARQPNAIFADGPMMARF